MPSKKEYKSREQRRKAWRAFRDNPKRPYVPAIWLRWQYRQHTGQVRP